MRAALFLLFLGCSSDRVNACSAVGSDPCVTFHLTAEPALVDALITSVAMWVTYDVFGSVRNQLVQTQMRAATHFPIAVGLDLPSGLTASAKIRIEALAGPGPAGYRVVTVSPMAAQHLDQDVMMVRQELSGCFDNTREPAETDLDCGGDCPPCNSGRHCVGSGDCQSAVCLGSATCE